MFLVGSALLNPPAQKIFLSGADRLVGFRRRHDRVRIVRLETLPEFTGLQVAGPNSHSALFVGGKGSLCNI